MSDKSVDEVRPVLFGEKLAASQNFSQLFRDGMKLVEETAAYLDGPGRQESKRLGRSAALGYATESMRLTTRLMQLASWLLLHRAVNEGEMSLAQANKERTKVKIGAGRAAGGCRHRAAGAAVEPDHPFEKAAGRGAASRRHHPCADSRSAVGGSNPLEQQLGILRAAFERSAR